MLAREGDRPNETARRSDGEDGSGTEPRLVTLMGVDYARLSLDEAVGTLVTWAEEGRTSRASTRFVAVTGFHGLWVAENQPGFRTVLNEADLLCADSIAPVVLSRLIGEPLPERVPGPDLFASALEAGAERGLSSFFLGDTPKTLEELRSWLHRRHPGHRVVGTLSPPFRPLTRSEEEEVVERVNASGADILWVALGTPKQERWIHRNLSSLEVPVAAAVGAAFRFVTGQARRAPNWLQSVGLEWAWRLALEPTRLWRRTLVGGAGFSFAALRWLLREGRSGASGRRRTEPERESQ